ncbi:MAG: phosphodiester glycosidase family protein [Moraxella sp.]|nr:phosphodiester glycosidase family protein [Moraxella sp.]
MCLYFIISDEPVNFYGFAKLFFELGCQNALFLDGSIASALYAKNLNRHDKPDMAVMVGFTP